MIIQSSGITLRSKRLEVIAENKLRPTPWNATYSLLRSTLDAWAGHDLFDFVLEETENSFVVRVAGRQQVEVNGLCFVYPKESGCVTVAEVASDADFVTTASKKMGEMTLDWLFHVYDFYLDRAVFPKLELVILTLIEVYANVKKPRSAKWHKIKKRRPDQFIELYD
jgi:hypothetical protein